MPDTSWTDNGHTITVNTDGSVRVECTKPDACTTKAGCDECHGRGFRLLDDDSDLDETCEPCKGSGVQQPVECWIVHDCDLTEALTDELLARRRRTGEDWPPPGRYVLEGNLIGDGEDAEFSARFGRCVTLAPTKEGRPNDA